MTCPAAGPLGSAPPASAHTGSGSQTQTQGQGYDAALASSILADHKYETESQAYVTASLGPAPLPVENPLRSFWLETSTDPGPAQGVFGLDTPLDEDVDVAIIGSGITGISAAYQLAHKLTPPYEGQQPKVAVIEARDFCSGATGRNGGHCTPVSVLSYKDLAADQEHLSRFLDTSKRDEHWGNDVGVKTDETVRKVLTLEARTAAELLMIVRMSIVRAKKAQAAVSAAKSDFSSAAIEDVEFVSGSNWHICQSKEEEQTFDESIEAAKRAGLSDFAMQVRKVPEAEWKQRLNDPDKITAAYEIPGSTVHPRRLVILLQKLAHQTAQRAGLDLKVFTHTPVTQVIPASGLGQTALVKTKRGDIKARYVIHASNAYASHLLPQLGGHDGVVPTRAQCLSMVPTHSPTPAEPLWQMGFSLNHGYEYLQQRPHPAFGQSEPPCILGGGRWAAKNMEFGVADDSEINPDVSNVIRPLLPTVFPHNFDKDTKPEMEWTGIIGYTKTSDPFVGPVLKAGASAEAVGPSATAKSLDVLPGQYVAAGYSGHGMTRAYSCAEIVADMIVADRAGVQWVPPAWFPLSYLTTFPPPPQKHEARNDTNVKGTNFESGSRFVLLAAGSNSGGQLGLGHDRDVHSWSQVLCVDPPVEPDTDSDIAEAGPSRTSSSSEGQPSPQPFPPPGQRVLQMSTGGANHTLALVGPTEGPSASPGGLQRRVWVCGDGTNDQLGPEPAGTSAQRSTDTASLRSIFLPMPEPEWIKSALPASGATVSRARRAWLPKLVAASWENSFVVYESIRSKSGHVVPTGYTLGRGEEDVDDVIFSFGSTNDFGQSGRDQEPSDSPTTRDEPLSLPVPARDAIVRDSVTGSEWLRTSRVQIEQLAAGVRHVLLLATWSEASIDEDVATTSGHASRSRRRAALIGWGAARHGQLGSGPFHTPSTAGTAGRKPISRFPLKRQKQSLPLAVSTPHRIHTWTIAEGPAEVPEQSGAPHTSTNSGSPLKPVLSAGREHSAILVPPSWVLDVSPSHGPSEAEAEHPAEARDAPRAAPAQRLFLLGSSRNGQLDVAAALDSSSPHVARLEPLWAGCTWNSTLLLLRSEGTSAGGLFLAASGKNDKGQLGSSAAAPRHAAEAEGTTPSSHHVLSLSDFLSQAPESASRGLIEPQRPSEQGPGCRCGKTALNVRIHCGSEHALLLLKRSGSASSSSDQAAHKPSQGDRESAGREDSVQLWGWGWNEHGNLALDLHQGEPVSSEEAGEADQAQEAEGQDQPLPVRVDGGVWPARDARHARHEPDSIWAGCATSFVQVRL